MLFNNVLGDYLRSTLSSQTCNYKGKPILVDCWQYRQYLFTCYTTSRDSKASLETAYTRVQSVVTVKLRLKLFKYTTDRDGKVSLKTAYTTSRDSKATLKTAYSTSRDSKASLKTAYTTNSDSKASL